MNTTMPACHRSCQADTIEAVMKRVAPPPRARGKQPPAWGPTGSRRCCNAVPSLSGLGEVGLSSGCIPISCRPSGCAGWGGSAAEREISQG